MRSSILDLRPSSFRETELLLNCARTQLDGETAARIKALLKDDIDWELLVQKALHHRTLPLLYRSLIATEPDTVPSQVLRRLRDFFDANARRNLFLTGELIRVVSWLESRGIPAIPYKGAALAAEVYGDIALRQFGDLDLLIPREHVQNAADLLVSLGFRSDFQISRAVENSFLDSQCELVLTRSSGRIIVELHWDIIPRYFGAALWNAVWDCVKRTPKDSLGLLSLPAEENFVALCIHGNKHCWERLIWISDVAQTMRVQPFLDWNRIRDLSRTLGSERIVCLAMSLAHDLLGAPLPDRFPEKLASVKRLTDEVRFRLCDRNDQPLNFLQTCRFHLKTRERVRDRLRYCLRLRRFWKRTMEEFRFYEFKCFLKTRGQFKGYKSNYYP